MSAAERPETTDAQPRDDVLDDVEHLIAALQSHADPDVRLQVTQLLQGIDAVHRTALTHLVAALGAMGGQSLLNRLIADPAIRLLLMSYDLLAVDRRLLAEEAIDDARGHLHAHGIDVELVDVVGGVVYVRLHGLEDRKAAPDAVLRDLTAALREGLAGFQEVVVNDRSSGTLVPLNGVKRAQRPVYQRVASAADLHEGRLLGVDAANQPVALARVEGEVFALSDRCGETPLPLHFSRLDGHVIECSWHGCRYDVRTGARIDENAALGSRLTVFPVREEAGAILVAIGTKPVARPTTDQ